MTDRPIIFSAPMVNAILSGRKSMTRRILKPQPPEWVARMCHEGRNGWIGSGDGHGTLMHVPYAVGDRLWVREAHAYDGVVVRYYATDHVHDLRRARSPIHMPRWASRLTLIVTDVRIQRLQDISEADAVAEGIEQARSGRFYDPTMSKSAAAHLGGMFYGPRPAFEALWTSIHGPDAWDANPWVAAISFETHKCNIDKMPGGAND